ncbi:MAG: hypothetical protein U5K30_01210 [Acidimicrobiales bacterium]|nr:hypothetical protein [Acidimicrobiales bacterium]
MTGPSAPGPSPAGPPPDEHDYAPSALPSTGARVLAFASILVAGLCGGLIGYAIVDLQCDGDCTVLAGLVGVAGAVVFAVGVGIVAVLAMRAMAEWRVIEATRGAGERDERS